MVGVAEGETALKAADKLLTTPHACKVTVGGAVVVGTADVAVPIHPHALEMRNSGLPTWFETHAFAAKVGMAVATTLVLVKVAQKD